MYVIEHITVLVILLRFDLVGYTVVVVIVAVQLLILRNQKKALQ
jgi:hypothetical protein